MSFLRSTILFRGLAGHSHYHNIRHRKARVDTKRQNSFHKLSKEIYSAIRATGGEINPNANPRLQRALEAARRASMPKDRIERALNHASTKSISSDNIVTFEAMCAGGIALLIRADAQHRNKITQEIRAMLARADGDYGKSAWIFQDQFTVIIQGIGPYDMDDVQLAGIEAGANEIELLEDGALQFESTDAKHMDMVQKTLVDMFPKLQDMQYTDHNLKPKTMVTLEEERVEKFRRLLDSLDENQDVIDVVHNVNI